MQMSVVPRKLMRNIFYALALYELRPRPSVSLVKYAYAEPVVFRIYYFSHKQFIGDYIISSLSDPIHEMATETTLYFAFTRRG